MAIFDFLKRTKKITDLDKLILRLKEDFREKIKNFQHFKELQSKKVDIIRKIVKIWNENLELAEKLIKNDTPILIKNQLNFIDLDIKYIDEEDFILNYLKQIEERKNTILGHYITQIIPKEYIENKKLIYELGELLKENSTILKRDCFTALKENLKEQLKFLERSNSWAAINQNQMTCQWS